MILVFSDEKTKTTKLKQTIQLEEMNQNSKIVHSKIKKKNSSSKLGENARRNSNNLMKGKQNNFGA